jgi:predicted DNA binding protein
MTVPVLFSKTRVDMLRVRIQVRLSGIQSQLLETGEAVQSVEIDNAFPVAGDEVFLFLTVRASSELSEEQLATELEDTEIAHMTQTAVSEHTYHLAVMVDRSGRSVLALLTENRAIPHQITGENAHITVVASVRDWQHLKRVAGAIEGAHGSLELIGTTQTEQMGYPLGSDKLRQTISGKLSDQQLSVLETAYEMGFFRVPQEVTAGEIASELGISRSTLSERLHRVQHDLCELLFGS